MTSIFLQLLTNGIITGAIYALVATGFSLIYSINKFVHFAHGGIIIFSSYMLYTLFALLDLNFYISCLLTIILSGLTGYLVNLFVYAPLRKKKASPSILLIASLAVLILFESFSLLIWGADLKTINFFEKAQGYNFFGAVITPIQIAIIVSSILLLIIFFFVMKKSRIGKAMRAVSDNAEVAEIVGISTRKVYSWAFFIGSIVAGVASILISLEQNIDPTMGTNLMIKGFTGAIIGGLGSIPGAVLGSFLLGSIENIGVWYLPSGYKDAIAFTLLFIFLLFRNNGILGIKGNNQND